MTRTFDLASAKYMLVMRAFSVLPVVDNMSRNVGNIFCRGW